MTRLATEPGDGPMPGPRSFCLVVADSAQARVMVLEPDRETGDIAGAELVLVADVVNPMVRVRNAGGLARGDVERHFAAEVAEEAAAVWSCYPPCVLILAAAPAMLAMLRAAIHARTGGPIDPIDVHELARDVTRLSGARLRDELIGAGLLPGRGASTTGGRLARWR